jgi:hypothetical protein
MTSTTHHPTRFVDGQFAVLNGNDRALDVSAVDIAKEDLAEQLDATLTEIAALPADTYTDGEREAYTHDAMERHLQDVAALEASPVAFLGIAGCADAYERAQERNAAARARAARERWDAMQAADVAREARRARDARTARARRAARIGYLPRVSGVELGLDFAAIAAADDEYAVAARGDLALAGLL